MPVLSTVSVLKWGVAIAALVTLAALVVLFVVTRIENQQVRDNAVRLQSGSHAEKSGADVAVVYFSRSGNTGVVAQHVAQRMGARLLAIQAPDYNQESQQPCAMPAATMHAFHPERQNFRA